MSGSTPGYFLTSRVKNLDPTSMSPDQNSFWVDVEQIAESKMVNLDFKNSEK